MATAVSTPTSTNPLIKPLFEPVMWSSGTLTYAFPTVSGDYGPIGTYGQFTGGVSEPSTFTALGMTQQAAAHRAMGQIMAVSAVTFAPGPTDADSTIMWGNTSAKQGAWAFLPNAEIPTDRSGGDIWFGTGGAAGTLLGSPTLGTYGGMVFIHELGHALGLAHPHEDGNPANNLPAEWDSQEFTLMTYRSYVGADPAFMRNEANGYAQSLMMLDIQALQTLYGANFGATANNTNTVYTWSETTGEMFMNGGGGQGAPAANRVFLTIWDGGGTDTYDMSNYANGVNIDLTPGRWSLTDISQRVDLDGWDGGTPFYARGNVFNALLYNGDVRSYIENAIGGAGPDVLAGNAVNNVLTGNGGDDTLYYFGGFDTLNGGTHTVGDFADFSKHTRGVWVNLGYAGNEAWSRTGPGPNDGGYNTAIADLNGIENVTGSDFNDDLTGNSGANLLEGGFGNDTFRWSGGVDTFVGGAGVNTLDLSGGTGNNHAFVNLNNGTFFIDTGGALSGIQNVVGGSGDDGITSGVGSNVINGGDGSDTFTYYDGRDILDGDGGFDRAFFSLLTGPVWVDMAYAGDEVWTRGNDLNNNANAWVAIADLIDIEEVRGSAFNDYLRGNASTVNLWGNDGDDRFIHNGTFIAFFGGAGAGDTAEFTSAARGIWVDMTYAGNDAWMRSGPGPNEGGYNIALADFGSIENVVGSEFNDDLRGDGGNNKLEGRGGNDTFRYSGGVDQFYGDGGTNTLDFSALTTNGATIHLFQNTLRSADGLIDYGIVLGIQNVIGTGMADFITAYSDNNVLNGGGGDDTLNYIGGRDVLDGDGGNDTASFGPSVAGGPVWIDMAFAGDEAWSRGNDLDNPANAWIAIADLIEIERVVGTQLNDYFRGTTTTLSLHGADGDDRFIYNASFILFDGGNGSDTAEFTGLARGLWVDLAYGGNEAWMRSGPGANDGGYNTVVANLDFIENIVGTAFNDFISGDGSANTFNGGGGNDELRGMGGNDILKWTGGFDILNGGADVDIADFSGATRGVWVHLDYTAGPEAWMRNGPGPNDGYYLTQIADLAGIECVTGSAFNDDLMGDNGDNSLAWTGGFDIINGGGGTGDIADFSRSTKGVWVNLGFAGVEAWARSGTGPNDGGYNTAIADLSGIEYLVGSAFNDELTGSSGDNAFQWAGGFDLLNGGSGGSDYVDFSRSTKGVWVNLSFSGVEAWSRTGPGPNDGGYNTAIADFASIEGIGGSAFDDVLQGSVGVFNLIYGGGGNDRIVSSIESDQLFGAGGADRFVFLQYTSPPGNTDIPVIVDFNASEGDKIDLSAIDANTFNGSGTNDTFVYNVGITSFDLTAGRLIRSGDYLLADTNGDGTADIGLYVPGGGIPADALIL